MPDPGGSEIINHLGHAALAGVQIQPDAQQLGNTPRLGKTTTGGEGGLGVEDLADAPQTGGFEMQSEWLQE